MLKELTRFTYFRGRVALAEILRGLGVRAGDEVLLQAFTCIAVPEAILSLGARPMYVDVAPGTPNMDPADLNRKINDGTRAIIVQHSFGLPADIVRLMQIASGRGVPVVEDCAHTVASRVDGKPVGSFGAGAFYSYEASKPVFVGIGGSALSNTIDLTDNLASSYERFVEPSRAVQLQLGAMFLAHRVAYRPSTYWTVRSLFRALVAAGLIRGNYNKVPANRNGEDNVPVSGQDDHAAENRHPESTGSEQTAPAEDFRRRLGTMQRRMLVRELARLERNSSHRRWVAEQYRAMIRAAGVAHLSVAPGAEPVYGRYPLLVESKTEVIEGARAARVELADFYSTAVHPLEGQDLLGVGYHPGSCPNAEWISERIVSLPTGAQVTQRQIDRAAGFFNSRAVSGAR